jgi:muramoyltetrapeptide carboxypeptidase LdcA involved in peptidoglycan recycling
MKHYENCSRNLCVEEDFNNHASYQSSIGFLRENNIDFTDFTKGANTIETMVEQFHYALDSDTELIWVVRGGYSCIQTLQKLDWNKIAASDKKFYGLSDFTHFAMMAVSKNITCYYGQGLSRITEYFPEPQQRTFITNFLNSGKPVCAPAQPLYKATEALTLDNEKVIGGHLSLLSFMQTQVSIDPHDRYIFFEYHTAALGEKLIDLGYYIDQLLFVLGDNKPKGFILGHTEMRNLDLTIIPLADINAFCVKKLAHLELPIYFIDHFHNTITMQ